MELCHVEGGAAEQSSGAPYRYTSPLSLMRRTVHIDVPLPEEKNVMSEGLGCTAIHPYVCTGLQWKAPDGQLCKQRCYHSRHSIIAWFVVRIIAWFVVGINVPINITTNLKLSRVLDYICSWWQMPLVSIQKVWTAFWPIAYLCFHQCLLSENLPH